MNCGEIVGVHACIVLRSLNFWFLAAHKKNAGFRQSKQSTTYSGYIAISERERERELTRIHQKKKKLSLLSRMLSFLFSCVFIIPRTNE